VIDPKKVMMDSIDSISIHGPFPNLSRRVFHVPPQTQKDPAPGRVFLVEGDEVTSCGGDACGDEQRRRSREQPRQPKP
jgi:hypothetical protein